MARSNDIEGVLWVFLWEQVTKKSGKAQFLPFFLFFFLKNPTKHALNVNFHSPPCRKKSTRNNCSQNCECLNVRDSRGPLKSKERPEGKRLFRGAFARPPEKEFALLLSPCVLPNGDSRRGGRLRRASKVRTFGARCSIKLGWAFAWCRHESVSAKTTHYLRIEMRRPASSITRSLRRRRRRWGWAGRGGADSVRRQKVSTKVPYWK